MRQLKIIKQVTNRETASLDKYLQEIGKVELITADEEVTLAQRIKQGDQAALEKLMAERTSFVIAHRLSTIRNADQVLVLVAGEIAEQGTHDELLAEQGVYYDLYMSQFRSQESVTAIGE